MSHAPIPLTADFLHALSCLDVRDLCTNAAVSICWNVLACHDMLWLELCRRLWSTKVCCFHLTAARLMKLQSNGHSWKEQYKQHLEDGARNCITMQELTTLVWDFTFRLHPQARASASFRFDMSGHVSGHPNGLTYSWRLSDDGRRVELGQFPQARVIRRADWGWAIANSNIVCCSLEDEDLTGEGSEGASVLHPELFGLDQLGPSLQLVHMLMRLQRPPVR